MSEGESSAHRDKEKGESEEKVKEANTFEKDSEDKEKVVEEEDTDQNSNNNNQNQHNNPLFEPSPSSITFHSPSPPSSSLRTRKSPSPPLHSPPDSPISDGHSSAGHISSSPPPKTSPHVSSPDSSISDCHFSVSYEVPPIGAERFYPAAPPVVVAHRFQVEPKVITKVDPGAEEGFVDVNDTKHAAISGGSGGGGGIRRLRPDVTNLLKSKKIAMLSKVLLGLRFTSLLFCLMSLSVLAADKGKGWAQDSFYRYKEFRFSFSVNVTGFVYSGLQICDLLKFLITRKHIVDHRLKGFINFALDQILTYLLMSASSSAATRAYDWESNWGVDKFPAMANASVALSFVAFVAFAFTSLISGSMLCRFR